MFGGETAAGTPTEPIEGGSGIEGTDGMEGRDGLAGGVASLACAAASAMASSSDARNSARHWETSMLCVPSRSEQ